jgi:hypothetical protein
MTTASVARLSKLEELRVMASGILFVVEAARRGMDTTERKAALRAILDAHSTPPGEGAYPALRGAIS